MSKEEKAVVRDSDSESDVIDDDSDSEVSDEESNELMESGDKFGDKSGDKSDNKAAMESGDKAAMESGDKTAPIDQQLKPRIHLERNNTSFPVKIFEQLRSFKWENKYSFLKYYQNLIRMVYGRLDLGTRGLLLYHDMGMGKTISAMAIAMDLLDDYEPIVLLTKSLRENARAGIIKYCELRGKEDPSFAPGKMPREDLERFIDKRFGFVSLNAGNMLKQLFDAAEGPAGKEFSKALGKKIGEIVRMGSLEGKLLIIDEAHNFFRAVTNGSANAKSLYDMVMATHNCMIVLLTGTPIANDPFELAVAANLLAGRVILPEDYKDFTAQFVDTENHTIKNKGKFQNRVMGLVSYIARNSPIGNTEVKFPRENPMQIRRIPMDSAQFTMYLLVRDLEKEEAKYGVGRGNGSLPSLQKPKSEKASSYRVKSRQISNYAPPSAYFERKFSEIQLAGIPPTDITSPKLRELLKDIHAAKGKVLVYSQFTGAGGIGVIKRFLELNGFEEYKPKSQRLRIIEREIKIDPLQVSGDAAIIGPREMAEETTSGVFSDEPQVRPNEILVVKQMEGGCPRCAKLHAEEPLDGIPRKPSGRTYGVFRGGRLVASLDPNYGWFAGEVQLRDALEEAVREKSIPQRIPYIDNIMAKISDQVAKKWTEDLRGPREGHRETAHANEVRVAKWAQGGHEPYFGRDETSDVVVSDIAIVLSPNGQLGTPQSNPAAEITETYILQRPATGEKIGHITLDYFPEFLMIRDVTVVEKERGKGYARMLVEKAVERARDSTSVILRAVISRKLKKTPKKSDGDPVERIVEFFRHFGFEVIERDEREITMELNKESKSVRHPPTIRGVHKITDFESTLNKPVFLWGGKKPSTLSINDVIKSREKYAPIFSKIINTPDTESVLVGANGEVVYGFERLAKAVIYGQESIPTRTFTDTKGRAAEELDLPPAPEYKGGDDTPRMKFAIISGEVPTEIQREIQEVVNSKDNLRGEQIRVLLISSTGVEGLDLKAFRVAIAFEPYWNYRRIDQFKSRVIRNDSHVDLPPEEQTVDSFVYVAVPPQQLQYPGQTTDEELMAESLKNQKLVESFLQALQEVSIECMLNGYPFCRRCLPTDEALFAADFHLDMKRPDPCREYKEEKVTVEEIEIAGTKYYYRKDPREPLGWAIFEFDSEINGYRRMNTDSAIYSDIIERLAQK